MPDGVGLGALLREWREAKGLSLETLSRDTRIALRLLLALEEDRLTDLPAPIFVRGFIRAYCRAVGEPPDRALTVYDSATGAARGPSAVPRKASVVQAPARRVRGLGRLAPGLGIAGALVTVGGLAYLATSVTSPPSDPPRPPVAPVAVPSGREALPESVETTAPAASAVAPSMPAPASTRAPAPPPAPVRAVAPTPVTPPRPLTVRGAVPSRTHVLVARAHEPTWVQVRPENGVWTQELLEAGTVRQWHSAGRFTLTVGNAGGLTLELDGVALPPLGASGQVVRDVRLPREPTP